MEPRRFTYEDLSGGLNEGLPAGAIADNETTRLENFFPFGGKLIRRGGTHPLSLPYYELLTSVFTYKPESVFGTRIENVDWTIFGGRSSLARMLPGPALTPLADTAEGSRLPRERLPPAGTIEPLSGPRLTPDDAPWTMLQYKSIGFALRRNAGLMRFVFNAYALAGIDRPTSAPTLSEGAAGALTLGTYRGVVTFVNVVTGAESNPSDYGQGVIIASKRITWSAVPVSTDPQVGGRRLYRTLPNAQGVYLFVGEILDNTTTTFDDNVTIAEMGDFVSFDNDVPPTSLLFGAFWQERLFASDGVDLLYSEPFLPESFGLDNVVRVFPDDGAPMTAVHAADQNRLIVGKYNAIHYLTPAGNGFARDTLDPKHGCVSPHSMKSAGGLLLWFGGNSFYRSLGGPAEDIASVKLKKTLKHVDPARYANVVSAIFPEFGWYLTALRVDNGYSPTTTSRALSTPNNVILCYNYRTGAWCKFTLPEGGPVFIADAFDATGARILHALLYDHQFYEFNRGKTDFGLPITAEIRTKAYRWGGLLSCIRRFFLLGKTVGATATYRLYKNQSETPAKTRADISLDDLDGSDVSWKGANMSTLGNPGGEWQLGIEYAGRDDFEIEALAFDTVPLARPPRIR